jgi:hypothetical protein
VERNEKSYQMRPAGFFLRAMLLLLTLSTLSFAEESKLNIIYTGSLQGQLEPCGCSPKSDFGGIARIAGYLAEHRDELSPFIIVDAGNFTGEDTPQGRLKAAAMINALQLIMYDAVAVSKNEQLFPDDFLLPLLQKRNLPVISGMAGKTRSISITKGGVSINISTDHHAVQSGKLNILLTDLPINDARSIKGWDVIISAAGEETDGPYIEGETIVAAGYPKGKKLGILKLLQTGERPLRFTHTWQPVGNDLQDHEEVQNVLNDYDKKVAKLMKEAERPPAGATYAGTEKCAECHKPFFEQWENTRHATAFSSLEEVGKSADPECVVCHVVGFGEKGGFFSLHTTPKLANVQCESCHGLNREHLSDYSSMQPVAEKVCRKCHTRENSPEFDYQVYLEKIKH